MPYSPEIQYTGAPELGRAGRHLVDFLLGMAMPESSGPTAAAIEGAGVDAGDGEAGALHDRVSSIAGPSKPSWGDRGMSGLKSMAEGFDKYSDDMKNNAKEASHLRGLLDVYDPENKDMHKILGLDDLRSKGSAIVSSQQQQEQQAKMAEIAAKMKEYATQTENLQSNLDVGKALQSFGSDFTSPVPTEDAVLANATIPHEFSPQDRMNFALSRNPAAFASPQFDNSIGALMRAYAPAADYAPKPFDLGKNGKGVYSPKGGQFQITPTDADSPPQVTLPDGSIATKTGKENWKVEKPKAAVQPTFVDVPGMPGSKVMIAPGYAPHTIHPPKKGAMDVLNDMTGATTGAPAAAGPAAPQSQSEYDKLPSGTLYKDPDTGKIFRKK